MHLCFNLFPWLQHSSLVLLKVLASVVANDVSFFVKNYKSGNSHNAELLGKSGFSDVVFVVNGSPWHLVKVAIKRFFVSILTAENHFETHFFLVDLLVDCLQSACEPAARRSPVCSKVNSDELRCSQHFSSRLLVSSFGECFSNNLLHILMKFLFEYQL